MTLDPRLTMEPGHPTPEPATGSTRKCWRHEWGQTGWEDDELVTRCARCGKVKDEAVVARNRKNRGRGKSAERGLADYLVGQNVGSLGWAWDCQGEGWRLQSKREAAKRSPAAIAGLIAAIAYRSDAIRGAYIVQPGQRLTSGEVWVLYHEWTEWHGYGAPKGARLALCADPDRDGWCLVLLALPLPTFRELHVPEAAA